MFIREPGKSSDNPQKLSWMGKKIQTHATDAKRSRFVINIEAGSVQLACPRSHNVAYNNEKLEIPGGSTPF